jgi:cardiolipin synthase
MEKIFATDQSHCNELFQAEWDTRDVYRRFTEMILNPLRHLL